MFSTALKWGVGLIAGGHLLGKMLGSDPDFTQAYMINRMTGQGGFWKTYFSDGLKSMFLGSRTASALYGSGGFGASLYGNPYMMGANPYMANPMLMGGMPYGMGFGSMMWGHNRMV
jgi:hypothetical protein